MRDVGTRHPGDTTTLESATHAAQTLLHAPPPAAASHHATGVVHTEAAATRLQAPEPAPQAQALVQSSVL